jgi:hypothetical protein
MCGWAGWIINDMCYYRLMTAIPYDDIQNDDQAVRVIAESINVAGFHFKTHSRVLEQEMTRGIHQHQGAALEALLVNALRAIPLVSEMIGHAAKLSACDQSTSCGKKVNPLPFICITTLITRPTNLLKSRDMK